MPPRIKKPVAKKKVVKKKVVKKRKMSTLSAVKNAVLKRVYSQTGHGDEVECINRFISWTANVSRTGVQTLSVPDYARFIRWLADGTFEQESQRVYDFSQDYSLAHERINDMFLTKPLLDVLKEFPFSEQLTKEEGCYGPLMWFIRSTKSKFPSNIDEYFSVIHFLQDEDSDVTIGQKAFTPIVKRVFKDVGIMFAEYDKRNITLPMSDIPPSFAKPEVLAKHMNDSSIDKFKDVDLSKKGQNGLINHSMLQYIGQAREFTPLMFRGAAKHCNIEGVKVGSGGYSRNYGTWDRSISLQGMYEWSYADGRRTVDENKSYNMFKSGKVLDFTVNKDDTTTLRVRTEMFPPATQQFVPPAIFTIQTDDYNAIVKNLCKKMVTLGSTHIDGNRYKWELDELTLSTEINTNPIGQTIVDIIEGFNDDERPYMKIKMMNEFKSKVMLEVTKKLPPAKLSAPASVINKLAKKVIADKLKKLEAECRKQNIELSDYVVLLQEAIDDRKIEQTPISSSGLQMEVMQTAIV